MLHFVWELQNLSQKQNRCILTKSETESKHLVQSPWEDGGLGEVEQSLPTTHEEFQVENRALGKAGKEQEVRTRLQ